MDMKAGLTFACMNLKKLARMMKKGGLFDRLSPHFSLLIGLKSQNSRKTALEFAF